jgi:3-oxoadipate enol-lactonase
MGKTETVAINGAKLEVTVDGDAGKPWLVLSNSLACTYDSWRFQLPALTGAYRVLRYNTRGHGGSSAPKGPYSLDILVSDVVGLMDHFKIAQADVVGLSMGGMTMMGLAIGHPDRVRRLICCDARSDAPPPFVSSWDDRTAAIKKAGGMKGILDLTLERWFTAEFREKHPEIVNEAGEMLLATNVEGYTACAEALKRLAYKPHLHEIKAPSLFLAGAQDMAAPSAVMREMATLAGGDFVEVDPGAHICTMENPEGFNRTVAGWLKI